MTASSLPTSRAGYAIVGRLPKRRALVAAALSLGVLGAFLAPSFATTLAKEVQVPSRSQQLRANQDALMQRIKAAQGRRPSASLSIPEARAQAMQLQAALLARIAQHPGKGANPSPKEALAQSRAMQARYVAKLRSTQRP